MLNDPKSFNVKVYSADQCLKVELLLANISFKRNKAYMPGKNKFCLNNGISKGRLLNPLAFFYLH